MVLVMLIVCIGIPLFYSWRIFRLHEPTLGAWALLVADAAIFVALVLLVGRWDMAGYYVRFAVAALFVAAVLWSFRKHMSRPWTAADEPVLRTRWTTLVSLVAFGTALVYVLSGFLPPSQPRELAFPLKDGTFVVGQGGGVGLLNHHASHVEQAYAADIVAIDAFGFRAGCLAPRDLDLYEVFGKFVVSPCDGTVTALQNDLPDLVPPESDRENARGNHVIIDCGAIGVELAHLQRGSVTVGVGDAVAAGAMLGKVGNSGNTTEPHLHVHAVDLVTRRGVPISFDGRHPVRNRVYVN